VDWIALTLERDSRALVNAVHIKLDDFFLTGCGPVSFSGTLIHGGRRFTERWNGMKNVKLQIHDFWDVIRCVDWEIVVDVSEERCAFMLTFQSLAVA
jgi:hypothetical protein